MKNFEKIILKEGAGYYKKQSKYIKCYSLEEIIRNIFNNYDIKYAILDIDVVSQKT